MSFPNGIYGKYGFEKDTTSSQKHVLGTRMELPDGRVFRYSEIGGADIAAGAVVQAAAGVAAHDQDLVVAAASAGDTTVTLSGSLTITKDQYKDGYMHINSGAGRAGQIYRIKSNTAVASATGCVLTLDEEDGLETALTAGSGNTEVGLSVNTYSNVIISPTTVTNVAIGVAPTILTSNYYGWLQTWGPASVLANAAGVVGEHVRVGGTGTAGGYEDLDRDGSGENEQAIGVQMLIAPATNDYGLVFLQISA
tara:strand:- start:210 stop:965 length:756 start_codon:yes stop_codon:yes gene_type:complete